MKVSLNWINGFLDGKLPKTDKLVELLTMHSMDVESTEKVGSDTVLDIKTTPNQNHTCLSHRGIARELGLVAELPILPYSRTFKDIAVSGTVKKLNIVIDDPKQCPRYIGRVVENIKVGPSPKWLVEHLETLGQRSINNVVDATNFVMLELGQPMHAFDADKLNKYEIRVRSAKAGEQITTLDKKAVMLDDSILLITDGKNPLAIAGVKGGTHAELDAHTTNIVLESANFNPTLIRKTAQKIKIQTDASKRYENELSPELCAEAMDILTKLIVEIAGTKETQVGEVVDAYPVKQEMRAISFSVGDIQAILGVKISEKEIALILDRFGFAWKNEKGFVVTVPPERLDLSIKEDMAEEIGRIYGYEKIPDEKLPQVKQKPAVNKIFAYQELIRNILSEQGFSEIMNYTFVEKGEVELANPMSPERKFLRTNLADGMQKSLELNARFTELLDAPQVKVFEFGHVFSKTGEGARLAIGVKNPIGIKKPNEKDVLMKTIAALSDSLNLSFPKTNKEEHIAEFDLEKILEHAPLPASYVFTQSTTAHPRFQKISSYPYMSRDIAVFTPSGTKADDVLAIILKYAGPLMAKQRLFDTFEKEGRVSYAYRLVFQSHDRTLSDDEVNAIMEKISGAMNAKSGWQVR